MPPRFVLARTPVSGAKVRAARGGAGDYLARLWSRFGPPEPAAGGFSYALREPATGLVFSAYLGPSGPALGGPLGAETDPRFAAMLDGFERWLATAPLADCRIEVGGDHGWRELGAHGGLGFDRDLVLGRPPASARTVDECVAIAREHGAGHRAAMGDGLDPTVVMTQGFADCLAGLIELRDTVIDGEDAEAICLAPGMTELYVCYDTATGSHNLPLTAALATPIAPAGALWLDAWAAWRTNPR